MQTLEVLTIEENVRIDFLSLMRKRRYLIVEKKEIKMLRDDIFTDMLRKKRAWKDMKKDMMPQRYQNTFLIALIPIHNIWYKRC